MILPENMQKLRYLFNLNHMNHYACRQISINYSIYTLISNPQARRMGLIITCMDNIVFSHKKSSSASSIILVKGNTKISLFSILRCTIRRTWHEK